MQSTLQKHIKSYKIKGLIETLPKLNLLIKINHSFSIDFARSKNIIAIAKWKSFKRQSLNPEITLVDPEFQQECKLVHNFKAIEFKIIVLDFD